MNPMTHAEAHKALFLEGSYLDLTDRHAAQYALGLAGRIERTAQELIDSLMDGNDAMRAVADEPLFSDEPFHDDIARTIAARKAESFKIGDQIKVLSGCLGCYKAGDLAEISTVDDTGDLWATFRDGQEWRVWCPSDGPASKFIIHADTIPVATPEEDAALDEIEARQVEASHPAPNFAPLDMVSFAADSLGLKKGA